MAAGRDQACDDYNCYEDPGNVCCTTSATDICPDGWHVPSSPEFKTLVEGLATPDCEASSAWNCSPAGTELQPGGTSGFDFLSVGFYNTNQYFYYRGGSGYLWSTSPWNDDNESNYGWNRVVIPNNPSYTTVYKGKYRRIAGFPVRCIRD